MVYRMTICCIMALAAAIVPGCKKAYEPAVFKSNNNYLVVDGFINTETNGITSFNLTRTTNVNDSARNIPELHAAISIADNKGGVYSLAEAGGGLYTSAILNLDNTRNYRVNINTSDGDEFQSDFVPCRQTPAIDSLNWKQDNQDKSVTIYASTHDPAANSRYYRWSYKETWEYHSQVQSIWVLINNLVYLADSTNQTSVCWNNAIANNVLLGNSTALSQDLIYQQPMTTIPFNDPRLDFRYSIQVSQYTLTADAYNYWQIIQKAMQQTGTLFDLQPSQLSGNLHSLKDPNEPVIGFISATTRQQSRIFIKNNQLNGYWASNPPGYACPIAYIDQDPNNFQVWHDPDPTWGPYYFVTGSIVITKEDCLDCRLQGGSNHQPFFW